MDYFAFDMNSRRQPLNTNRLLKSMNRDLERQVLHFIQSDNAFTSSPWQAYHMLTYTLKRAGALVMLLASCVALSVEMIHLMEGGKYS